MFCVKICIQIKCFFFYCDASKWVIIDEEERNIAAFLSQLWLVNFYSFEAIIVTVPFLRFTGEHFQRFLREEELLYLEKKLNTKNISLNLSGARASERDDFASA